MLDFSRQIDWHDLYGVLKVPRATDGGIAPRRTVSAGRSPASCFRRTRAPNSAAILHCFWSEPLKFDISGYKNVVAYMARVANREKVRQALQDEGLLKAA